MVTWQTRSPEVRCVSAYARLTVATENVRAKNCVGCIHDVVGGRLTTLKEAGGMSATTNPSSSPSWHAVAWPYVLVIAAGVGAWQIYTQTDPKPLVVDVEGFAVFAPLYIAAQAIERFLEPLAALINVTTGEKSALKAARAHKARLEALPANDPQRTLDQLAAADTAITQAEHALAKAKAERAIPLWAAATVLGLLVCAILGLGLVEAIAKERPTSEFLRTVDVLLTGLAVGAGTKPLHDLIARIEKAKDNADAATKPPTGSAPS